MPRPPAVGAAAPDFELPGIVLSTSRAPEIRRGTYRLSERPARPLLLAFYPGDDTPVCTRQLCSYSAGLDGFASVGTDVWAISRQDLDSHESFARGRGIELPLLSDLDGTVTAAYGIAVPGLGLRRSVFLVDVAGIVRWRHVGLVGLSFPSREDLLAAVASLDR
ncbi:peroxiredoxin family protein [Actinocatenispora sera]|uniref:peroxiredoxin family protein n=1 Tax=Actinocatenispora sera TaxID=390989 RepID=UPI0033CB646B